MDEAEKRPASDPRASDAADVLARRDVLQRAAVLGGTMLWITPVIQVLDVRIADAASGASQPLLGGAGHSGRVPPGAGTSSPGQGGRTNNGGKVVKGGRRTDRPQG